MSTSVHLSHTRPAGESLAQSLRELGRDMHPVVIISAYNKVLKEAAEIIKRIIIPIEADDDEQMG